MPDGDELSVSQPGSFNPRERAHDIHWIGGRMGPRADLDMLAKNKILFPL
jgi:hypothetical protein